MRPPVYLDNLFSPWNGPALVNDGVLAYPLPAHTPVAWLSHDDLAEAVHAALTAEGAVGRVFDIGGARTLTGDELAAAFQRGLGRSVRYVPLEPAVFEQGLAEVLGAKAAAGVAGSTTTWRRTPTRTSWRATTAPPRGCCRRGRDRSRTGGAAALADVGAGRGVHIVNSRVTL